MWVADDRDNRIYAYDAIAKTRTPDKEISGVSAEVRGIWSDGETMWVADWVGDRIVAYNMTTKARVPDEEFNGLAAVGNNHPEGIWSDGATMWVSDLVDDRIYAYDMATKAQDADKEFDALVDFGSDSPRWPQGPVVRWSDNVDYRSPRQRNLRVRHGHQGPGTRQGIRDTAASRQRPPLGRLVGRDYVMGHGHHRRQGLRLQHAIALTRPLVSLRW